MYKKLLLQLADTAGDPVDPATETTLQDVLTALGSVTTPSDTQPISAASLPLPTGAATEVTLAALNPLTDAQLRASAPKVDTGLELAEPATMTVTDAGDTTVYTPTSGKCIRLRKVRALYNPVATVPPVMTLKIGSLVIDYGFVISGRMDVTGAVNDALVLNLDTAVKSTIIAWLEEVDP